MTLKRLFLVIITNLICLSISAQFNENFDNGSISDSPVWYGDTTDFVINAQLELQLNAPAETGERYIYTSSKAIENAEWLIDVKMDFNPTSANYTEIHLVSDSSDLTVSNGYFVRIGNTSDEISLYRKDGSNNSKIIDGADDRVDVSPVNVRVKINRDADGNWTLHSDMNFSGTYVFEGEVFDNTYLGSEYFGIYCDYSSTRSDKFFFDNISVIGESKSDINPPEIVDIKILNEKSMEVHFSENILLNESNPASHFLENCQYQQPDEVELVKDSIIQIHFTNDFPENQSCELIISNISDKANNALNNSIMSFTYIPPVQPGFNQLLITEIMPDPSPNVELPEVEYLEIYNPTEETFEMKGLELHIRGETNVFDPFQIKSGEYIIVCSNPSVEDFSIYGRAIGLSNWKSLLNGRDTLTLYNRHGEQVFALAYSKDWYKDPEKSDGGFSLEMVDTNNPCGGTNNWQESESETGGTPGITNSVKTENPDLAGPIIQSLFSVNEQAIEVNFNERIAANSVDVSDFSFQPGLTINEIFLNEPLYNSASFKLQEKLSENEVYTFTMQGITDCVGNLAQKQEIEFVLPQPADSLDILFNEVMFNPVTGGQDFIELFNVSDKYIDIKNWKFQRIVEDKIENESFLSSSHFILKPKELIVFAENKDVLVGQYPKSSQSIIVETELIPLNDDEGEVLLTDQDEKVIDRLYYNEDFHHPFIKNNEGVSLERISHTHGSSEAEVWQSASSTAGFATPGLKNSHFTTNEMTSSFFIEPKVFAPDNDGYRDFAQINFQFDNPGLFASVFIYDLSGRVVKTLLNHQSIGTEDFIIWYGDNENGQKVSIGNYIVLLEVIDDNGETKVFKETVAVAKKF
mgnify:CR=1 FL=1